MTKSVLNLAFVLAVSVMSMSSASVGAWYHGKYYPRGSTTGSSPCIAVGMAAYFIMRQLLRTPF
jgi:hypothetical protein